MVADTFSRGQSPSRGPAAQAPLTPARRSALRAAGLPFPVILYLLCVLIPVGFNLGPLAMTALRALLIVMILPLLAQLAMGKFGRVLPPDLLFVLHILWAVVALAANNPDQMVQQVGSVGVEFLGGYLMGRAYIRRAEDFMALGRWVVFLVLLSMPFALYEAQTGRPLILEGLHRLGLTAVAVIDMEGRMGLERVQASFAHPIHYGLFCSASLSLAFVALRGTTSGVWRFVSSLLVMISGFLALSSGALLAIVMQVFLILWATVFTGLRWRWGLLLGVLGLGYGVVDLLSNRTPIEVFMSYATFSAHNAYWRSIIFDWGMKSVWAHPIFGIGMNDWVRPWFMRSGSMDNFWLVMGVRYGIPGFALLVAGYVWGLWAVMMRPQLEADPVLARIRRAWVFTFVGLSFTLTTVHVWTNIYSFIFFLFGAGMWLLSAAPSRTESEQAGPERTGTEPTDTEPTDPGRKTSAYSRFAPRKRADAGR